MKSAFLFLAGSLVGAVITWFVFSKDVIMVPSGTTLVEVNRFNGSAREVYYSYEEANRLRREEDLRVEKDQEAWEKANNPAVSPDVESKPAEPTQLEPLSAEELAKVQFIARIEANSGSPRLDYSMYNGTSKALVQATVRVEGVRKEGNIPLARVVDVSLNIKPSTDSDGSAQIEHGYFNPNSVEGLKISLITVLARPAKP